MRSNPWKFAALGDDIGGAQVRQVMIADLVVIDPDSKIVRGQVERDRSLIKQQNAMSDFGSVDGQVEERVRHRTMMFCRLGSRLVRAPVGINDQMKDRILPLKQIQAYFRLKERDDLGADEKPVDVGIRNLAGCFKTVNGDVVGLEFQMQQMPAKCSHLRSPTGSLLQRSDQPVANPGLEGGSARIPGNSPGRNGQHYHNYRKRNQKQAPLPARKLRRG